MSTMIDYWTKSAKDSIDKLAEENAKLQAEVVELRKPWGAFMPYEQLLSTNRSYDVTKDRDWETYQKDHARDLEVAERNAEAVKHNDAIAKRLIDTIEALGFRKEWSDFGLRKTKTVTADWLKAIRGAMPRQPESASRLQDQYRLKSEAREKHLKAAKLAEETSVVLPRRMSVSGQVWFA